MQTKIINSILETRQGKEADAILRRCVHCGFCNAVCPTYQLFNNELDGPRGRIYLVKQLLEGADVSSTTQHHLDRCLLCRSCETTCPSGVEYSRLAELGKHLINKQVTRSTLNNVYRAILAHILPRRSVMNFLLLLGRAVKFSLPPTLQNQLSLPRKVLPFPRPRHTRKILLLEGCIQSGIAPAIDASLARVLDRIGLSVQLERQIECCGAVEHHLDYQQRALHRIKANIDKCWPHIEAGVESIVMSASGCSLMLKDYAYLLQDEQEYSEKARQISTKIVDIVEILQSQDLGELQPVNVSKSISYHAPCTQQHGLTLPSQVKTLLLGLGFRMAPVGDSHLCCGSAGTYSLLNPAISEKELCRYR